MSLQFGVNIPVQRRARPCHCLQGRSQKFVLEGTKRGLGTEVPQRGPGHSPDGGDLAEAEDIYANNHCNNVLTKKPVIFSAWKFPGGGHVPRAPLPTPLIVCAYYRASKPFLICAWFRQPSSKRDLPSSLATEHVSS